MPHVSTAAMKRGSAIVSITALPTATASGLPPKVEAWLPAVMPAAAREVAVRRLVEAGRDRSEAVQVLRVSRRREGRERAAVKTALEGEHAPALGPAGGGMVAARQLDRALVGLGARVAEERELAEAHAG